MPVRDTSIAAKQALRDSGELNLRQQFVLSLVRRYPNSTACELAKVGGVRLYNYVQPRLTELEARNLIKHVDKRKCTVTGRGAYTWHSVDYDPQGRLF